MVNQLFLHVAIVIVGLFIIVKSADYVVYGVERYSRRLGLSGSVTGLIIISIAASMPEIFSALNGMFAGSSDVLFGSLIGNNFVHMGLLIGLIILFSRTINLEYSALQKSLLWIGALFLVPFVLMADGRLSRFDGFLLLTGYITYLVMMWRQEKASGGMKKHVPFKHIWKDGLVFIVALGALLLGARLLVFSSLQAAHILNIPPFLVAITIIGVGGAIDDFAIGLQSVRSGKGTIGVGDAIGSVMNEFLLFFGVVGIIKPLDVPIGQLWLGAVFLVVATMTTLTLLRYGKIRRWHGIILISLYFIYLGIEIGKAF